MDKSDKDEIKGMIDFGDSSEAEKTQIINIPEIKTEKAEEEASEAAGTGENSETAAEVSVNSEELTDDNENIDDRADNDIDDSISGDDIDDDDSISDDIYIDDDDDIDYDDESDYSTDDTHTVGNAEDKSSSKKGKIIKFSVTAAVIAALIIVFAVTDTGFIGSYKANFANNFRHIFGLPNESAEEENQAEQEAEAESAVENNNENKDTDKDADKSSKKTQKSVQYTEEKSSVIIPYEYANISDYAKYGSGIVCAATNRMQYINSDGKTEWECTTSVIDPILVTDGKYILLAQKDGTKICLYENNTLLYDADTEGTIITADVSSNGDSVLVTDREMYSGTVEAYNKRGDCIYLWSSGDMNVLDASISPSSRNIAAAMVNTDSVVYSTVRIFDIAKEGVKSETTFEGTLLFDIKYFGDVANAFGDNLIAGVKSNGKTVFNIDFENAPIVNYTYDDNGNKLVCAEVNNAPTLMIFNSEGKQKGEAAVDELPSFLGIDKKRILYNAERYIISGKIGDSKLSRYNASMDVKDLIMIDKNTFFVVYSNSLQLVKI